MRDLKFRGLGIDGKWWFGESNPSGENHINLATFFANIHGGAIRPETVGEWTGLHDKNGKEIYEGDIFPHNGMKLVVRYELGAFVGHWHGSNEYIFFDKFANDEDDIEIIGNIYENSELLNGHL